MSFSIKQIVHVVEDNIEIFTCENNYETRCSMQYLYIISFSDTTRSEFQIVTLKLEILQNKYRRIS